MWRWIYTHCLGLPRGQVSVVFPVFIYFFLFYFLNCAATACEEKPPSLLQYVGARRYGVMAVIHPNKIFVSSTTMTALLKLMLSSVLHHVMLWKSDIYLLRWQMSLSFILIWILSSLSHPSGTNGVSLAHSSTCMSETHSEGSHGSPVFNHFEVLNNGFHSSWITMISRSPWSLFKRTTSLNDTEDHWIHVSWCCWILCCLTLLFSCFQVVTGSHRHLCLIGPNWQNKPLLPYLILRLELCLKWQFPTPYH